MNEILDLLFSFWVGLAVLVFVLAKSSVKFVPQNRAFVVERFGKYNKTMLAGLNFLVPFIDKVAYDRSLKEHAYDVPSQAAITRDNISLVVDGVLYLKVLDPYKASYGVDNYVYAVTQLAQTTMRNIVGGAELDEVLANREELSDKIRAIIDAETDKWGIKVDNVELKDFFLPEDMERTIAKQAEAEREKRAVIINAEGEVIAAENIATAAKMLAESPGALHLRTLQTLNDLSSDQSNTVIFAMPIEVLRAVEGVTTMMNNKPE